MAGPIISVTLPYRGTMTEFVQEGYDALDDLRARAIRCLDKKRPKNRGRIPFYSNGQKHGTLYYHVGMREYVYDTNNFVYTIYKNGSIKSMRRK